MELEMAQFENIGEVCHLRVFELFPEVEVARAGQPFTDYKVSICVPNHTK